MSVQLYSVQGRGPFDMFNRLGAGPTDVLMLGAEPASTSIEPLEGNN